MANISNHLLINIAKEIMNLADKLPPHESSLSNRLRDRSLELVEDGFLYLSIKEHLFLHKKEFLPQLQAKINILSALISVLNERKYFEEEAVKRVYESIDILAKEFYPEIEIKGQGKSYPQQDPLSSQNHNESTKMSYPQPLVNAFSATHEAVPAASLNSPDVSRQPVFSDEPLVEQAVSVVWKGGGIASKGWSFNEGLLPDRQRHIFILMREKRRSSLKEICQIFPNLSEKTIRNDLNVLCERGLIQRVGVAPRSYYITA